MPLSPGQMLTQRYRIVRLLGQGGFGAVYRAWDVQLAGPCAIKESLDTTGDEGRQFEREARMLFKLRHPRLPRVFDYFVLPEQGRYLVMDYIDGEDLDTLLEKRGGRLPPQQALDWILQTCEPLAYLHEQTPPVIHRDLKPANIRLASDGQIYLVDFGIAKMYHPSQATATGARAVTSGYSPPEQYTSGTTDARSDVFALGATLYHLLTGRRPPDSLDVLLRVEPPPPPAHRLNPAVSQALSSVIQRAMQLEKNDRWAGIAELKQELERAVRPPQDPGFVVAPSMPAVVHPSVIETPAPQPAPPVSPLGGPLEPSHSAPAQAPPPAASLPPVPEPTSGPPVHQPPIYQRIFKNRNTPAAQPRRGGLQKAIIGLTLASVVLHILSPNTFVPLLLHDIGFLLLVTALYLPSLRRYQSLIRWIFIALISITILYWVAFGWQVEITYIGFLIDVVLIVLLLIEGKK